MDVHVNAAMSVDGKLATVSRKQLRISGPNDFDRVDELRARVDAVMVGVGTVLADDPSLTVDSQSRIRGRQQRGDPEQPTRIVADSRARTPTGSRIVNDEADTVLLVSDAASAEQVTRLEAHGCGIYQAGTERVAIADCFSQLEADGIESILVEGGGELIFSLFEAELVDRLSLFLGPLIIGGESAPTLADGTGFADADAFPQLKKQSVEELDNGVLLEWDVSYPDV